MRQTRSFKIERKVFTLHDIVRIAAVPDRQQQLAKKSKHHHFVRYTLHFSDNTAFESDSASIFSDEAIINTKRPVRVSLDFCNYANNRRIEFSVTHGSSSYGNQLVVSGEEPGWVNDNFTRLREAVDATKPQGCWLANHPTVLVGLMALGIGSLGMLLLRVLVEFWPGATEPVSAELKAKLAWLREIVSSFPWLFCALGWLWRCIVGFAWGAIPLSNWFLKAWPDIELDFGADHLKEEKRQRERILAVWTLVVLPVALTVVLQVIDKLT